MIPAKADPDVQAAYLEQDAERNLVWLKRKPDNEPFSS